MFLPYDPIASKEEEESHKPLEPWQYGRKEDLQCSDSKQFDCWQTLRILSNGNLLLLVFQEERQKNKLCTSCIEGFVSAVLLLKPEGIQKDEDIR